MIALSPVDLKIQRCVWLAASLLRDYRVDYATYAARYRASPRTYYRDLSVLRRVGLIFAPERTPSGRGVALVSVRL